MSASSCASSDVDARGEFKADIRGVGDIASKDEPLDILLGSMVMSGELTLADRPCVTIFCEDSILALRAATTLFADWPRPTCCGREVIGGGRLGMGLDVVNGAAWADFIGEIGLCGADKVLWWVNIGEVIREEFDIVEPGLFGG